MGVVELEWIGRWVRKPVQPHITGGTTCLHALDHLDHLNDSQS